MEKDKTEETIKSLGIANLRIFGINIPELIKNLTGYSLEEIAKNPELIEETRKALKAKETTLSKIVGDKVKIDYRIKTGGILGKREISSLSSKTPSKKIKEEVKKDTLEAASEIKEKWEKEEDEK